MSSLDVDPRLVAALTRQLARRHGDRVGWKLGVGNAERIGKTLAVGHLTTSTLLEDGQTYDAGGDGSVVQIAADLGDEVTADFGELGRVTLKLA